MYVWKRRRAVYSSDDDAATRVEDRPVGPIRRVLISLELVCLRCAIVQNTYGQKWKLGGKVVICHRPANGRES